MKLEYQVVSLELAKELREAEYPQEGHFWWMAGHRNLVPKPEYALLEIMKANCVRVAPTAPEVLEKLPHEIEKDNKIYVLRIMKTIKGDYIVQYSAGWDRELTFSHNHILANALAKMYLYLEKEGLLK